MSRVPCSDMPSYLSCLSVRPGALTLQTQGWSGVIGQWSRAWPSTEDCSQIYLRPSVRYEIQPWRRGLCLNILGLCGESGIAIK